MMDFVCEGDILFIIKLERLARNWSCEEKRCSI